MAIAEDSVGFAEVAIVWSRAMFWGSVSTVCVVCVVGKQGWVYGVAVTAFSRECEIS